MNTLTPKIVYHYCSLESFISIINNSTIRLSNIYSTNDRGEIRYSFNTFEKTLRQTCKEFTDKYFKNKELAVFFNNISYDELVSKAVLNDSLIYYIGCFSTESDLLSQWRGYANDGKGVAIGFYSNSFLAAKDLKNIKFNKIIYDMDAIEVELHDYILYKLIKAHAESSNNLIYSVYENAISDITCGMVYNAVFCKNPAFKEENEWRLVFYPFGNIRNLQIAHKYMDMASNYLFYDRMLEPIEYKKDYHGLSRCKLGFKHNDNKITSYIDMSFENIKQTTIAEIVIGPKSEINDRDLRLFLMANGYDLSKIGIRKSTATYR